MAKREAGRTLPQAERGFTAWTRSHSPAMTEREPDLLNLTEQSRSTVRRILASYGWRLIDEADYVGRVLACLLSGEIAEPWPAAVHVYCKQLYRACCGDEGAERQNLAFTELQRYLYALSFREIQDLASELRHEAVNEALLRIWERLSAYYRPGAFLAVAALELRNVLRPFWSRPIALVQLEAADRAPSTNGANDPVALALRQDLRRQVRACFDMVRRKHPRAREQLEAVWLKYIAGFDDQAISAYLGKKVANVYVLRSRGLDLLRAEPAWRLIAADLDLGDAASSAQ